MTLTAVATLTRRLILFFIIITVLSTAGLIAYRIWYEQRLASIPPPEEKSDTKFGILPKLDLPAAQVSTSNFSYSLDTVSGGLPIFNKNMKVFYSPKSYASFASPEKAVELAQKFDFSTAPEALSETRYLFKDSTRSLIVDLDSGNLSYQKIATQSATASLDEDNKLTVDFKNFLESKGLLKEDLKFGPTKLQYFKLTANQIVGVESRSEAQGAQISIWPTSIQFGPNDNDKIPIITPEFNKSLVNCKVLSSASDLSNYISLDFIFYPVDTSTFATYPIKSSEQAFAELQAGQGVVLIEPTTPQVSITSVYLAYFQSQNYSPYLQPIFVFEGSHFVALIPAITSDYINLTK